LVRSVAFVVPYSKLIGCEIEGKEYAAAGGYQAFLVVVVYFDIVL
jgi:hypothetical protein